MAVACGGCAFHWMAPPDDVGGAQVSHEVAGHRLEQRVAGGVAVPVVDRLEAVEVDEHQRCRSAVALDEGQRAPELTLEAAAIEYVEHGIDVGALFQLGDLPFGADQSLAQAHDLGAQFVCAHGIDSGLFGGSVRVHPDVLANLQTSSENTRFALPPQGSFL